MTASVIQPHLYYILCMSTLKAFRIDTIMAVISREKKQKNNKKKSRIHIICTIEATVNYNC